MNARTVFLPSAALFVFVVMVVALALAASGLTGALDIAGKGLPNPGTVIAGSAIPNSVVPSPFAGSAIPNGVVPSPFAGHKVPNDVVPSLSPGEGCQAIVLTPSLAAGCQTIAPAEIARLIT